MQGRRPVVLGEGGDLFTQAVLPSLAGTTPAESRIGEQTGLNVVAIEEPNAFETDLSAVSSNPFCNGVILSGALGAHARAGGHAACSTSTPGVQSGVKGARRVILSGPLRMQRKRRI